MPGTGLPWALASPVTQLMPPLGVGMAKAQEMRLRKTIREEIGAIMALNDLHWV